MSKNDASRIIIDDSRAMLQIVASLNDNFRGVIYNRNIFIVQATGLNTAFVCSVVSLYLLQQLDIKKILENINYKLQKCVCWNQKTKG